MPAPILAFPAIAPVVGGASKLVPPLMQNPMLMGGAGMLAGAAARPVMDTMGRVIDYGAGAPVNMETAKERGLAGVAGGLVDNLTMGATDFDKRGESKKQKDTKDFLRKFIFGTQGDAARKTRDELGGGNITSFSPGPRPELGEFNYSFDASERAKSADFMRNMMAAKANNAVLQQRRR